MMIKTDKTYFVELIPTGYYFFGNERTFNTTLKDKYGAVVSNYFAESNDYPQQTALLGMLRHSLLILYDKLEAGQNEKDEIIGSENFSIHKDSPYGMIEGISPLVIYNNNKKTCLLPAGFDYQHYEKGEVSLAYTSVAEKGYTGSNTNTLPALKNFNYKEPMKRYWTDGTTILDNDTIFKSVTKTGVDKDGTTDAFYKQTLKGLNDNYSFGLWVSFTDKMDISKLKDILIPFGADQGLFKLKFHANRETVFPNNEESFSFNKIVLLSDAWIDDNVFEKVDFGITAFTSFRFIDTKKKDYYKLSTGNKSNKYSLLQRGSVLYPKANFDITILNNAAMQRIGYNYFKHT